MKFSNSTLKISLLFVLASLILFSCIKSKKGETVFSIFENTPNIETKFKEIRDKTPIKIAEGLEIKLWASDSLAPDPIAMSVDDAGNIYLTRTNRQKNSEFDIRGHQNWMTPSISLQTVEDRRNFLRETFASSKSQENSWLKDLNEDGVHDWKDLAVEKEEIWKLEDRNKDGFADKASIIYKGFNEEITDVAGALLVRENDVFVGVGPDMWRLTDFNKNGVLTKKQSISHGYAVHIGFGGHGMSGAIEGPDGRIYWGIGDIGANLTSVEGKKYEYPNEGVIVRSNPDGTDFEIFASGLRNTHEFVFDQYGNIISADNDGDHPGESERLVHIVEGSDAGWRSNWQYGKYTDPKNNKYKVWMDEKLFKPRWEGQAAYIIPPIMNFHNGPTGMQFNPGTALGKNWLNKFFLVEFVGSPTNSKIWSFNLKPKGASFDLDKEQNILSGILPTGIKFGPDGALYVADWINGWDTKNYGRVWKLDVDNANKDLEAERKETQRLMQLKYPLQTDLLLGDLLAYSDMRIRQKAQLELAKRGQKGFEMFSKTLKTQSDQLARIHAIWGIGITARKNSQHAATLLDYLNDKDPEIITQCLKILGDLRYTGVESKAIENLKSDNYRVKFYAAEALGRIQSKEAIKPLIAMLEKNNDEDLYLRHAGVLALSRIGAENEAVALSQNKSKALRTAAVLVLRRLKSEKVAVFLKDSEEYIVTEAARAINDDLSIPAALPALADVLKEDRFSESPLLRRAINAALRVGTSNSLDLLINFSKRKNINDEIRAEAIATLATWAEPSVLDRVDGRFRGVVKRDISAVRNSILPHIPVYLEDSNPETVASIAQLLSNLEINTYNEQLAKLFNSSEEEKVKVSIIEALTKLNYDKIEPIIKAGMANNKTGVRTAAIGSISKLNIDAKGLRDVTQPIFEKGFIREKQRLISTLGTMPLEKTQSVFESLIQSLKAGNLENELLLELSEAVTLTKSEKLISQLPTKAEGNNWLEEFKISLFGGNLREGRNIFNNNSAAQCVRCHSVGEAGTGAIVGPNLRKIGANLNREGILEALVNPSGRLAPGYGIVNLILKDGTEIMGTVASENDHEIVLTTSDAEPTKVALNRISKRENMPSSMPNMADVLSKREIRDLVEYLANLK
jgi:quinoprotein glucose dehydrogenase